MFEPSIPLGLGVLIGLLGHFKIKGLIRFIVISQGLILASNIIIALVSLDATSLVEHIVYFFLGHIVGLLGILIFVMAVKPILNDLRRDFFS